MKTTLAHLLPAVLATAALAVAAAPRSEAADSVDGSRFSITIDGYEIASFRSLEVADGSVTFRSGTGTRAVQTWALTQKRADPDVVLYSTDGKAVARYHLESAWPSKVEISGLKAGASEVLMESLTLCHEGFEVL
jgi:hypothetical protein